MLRKNHDITDGGSVPDDRKAASVFHDTGPVNEVASAAVCGDKDAWSRLVARFMPLVKSIIRSYALSGQDADDVSQTLWLRLVEHLQDIRDPKALPGWIATTTRNECVQLLRSARRTVPVGVVVEHHPISQSSSEIEEDLLAAERHQMLLQALAQLPDHQRRLLTLLVADPPLTYAEIGRRLGVPTGSLGPTRHRALQRLREFYAMAAIRETNTERIQ